MKQWLPFFLSFTGRAARREFNIPATIIFLGGSLATSGLDKVFDTGHIIAGIWNYLGLFLLLAVTCRRLHDLNFSGWWQVPVQLLSLGVMIAIDQSGIEPENLGDLLPLFGRLQSSETAMITILVLLLVYLVFFLLLSCKHGTKGPNQYGADPLQTTEILS